MKKIVSAMLALALILSSCSLCFATSQNKVLQTVKALGIMTGDTEGNMNVSGNLTRAQLAKMLVIASGKTLKEDGTGFSLYTDVSKDHWAGKYIYQATKSGYLTGYTDSSFRPENNVLFEEVCSTMIKLLGYSAKDLEGTYPDAYIQKADDLGLLDNVSCGKGDYITRGDCANMFYNCLLATTSSGQTYGTVLGCTVNNGVVSYTVSEADSDNEDGFYIGVISKISQSTSASSSTGVSTSLTVSCTDGVSRSYTVDKALTYTTGKIVQVKMSDGVATVTGLSTKSLEGKINGVGTYLGEYKLAEEVGILDSDSYGNTELVDIEDVKGITLSSDDVKYYSLNSAGYIDTLVLDDVTGKLWTKVYMTSVITSSESNGKLSLNGSYSYLNNGESRTLNTSDILFSVNTGGALIKFSSAGEAQSMKNMGYAKISSMTESYAMSDNTKYSVADDVQVYVKNGVDYYLSDVATVSGGEFKLQGWYTKVGTGNVIQIVIATRIAE